MSFNFRCPYCSLLLSTEEKWGGQEVQCPSCNNRFPVPSPAKPTILAIPQPIPMPQPPQPPQDFPSPQPTESHMPSLQRPVFSEPRTPFGATSQQQDFPSPQPTESHMPFLQRPVFSEPRTPFGATSQQFEQTAKGFAAFPAGKGKFYIQGSYHVLWNCVRMVFPECECQIQEENPYHGNIIGKCPYGINLFGMTVTACMYMEFGRLTLKFSANFTDAFDIFGACAKKVSEIADHFMAAVPRVESDTIPPPNFPAMPPYAS